MAVAVGGCILCGSVQGTVDSTTFHSNLHHVRFNNLVVVYVNSARDVGKHAALYCHSFLSIGSTSGVSPQRQIELHSTTVFTQVEITTLDGAH